MNYSVVIYILGWIMEIEAAFLALPGIVSAIYGEKGGFAFLWVALGSAVAGSAIILRKPKNMRFYLREGFVTVALSWILMSVIGCLPFVINGDIPHFADALFEMISGFTTTGATVVSDVEGLTKGSLFWRSFSHWIGGMGVLVFLLAIVPMAGGSHMNLMKAESPGPSVGKLVPKVRQTAKYLYIIYFALTVIEVIFLLFGRMNLFDALTTAFGTAGTGGFAIWNDGFVSVSPYNQWVVTIFMLLFGVNFGFYFLILTGKLRDALKFEEVRIYFIIVIASAIFIFINLRNFALYAPADGVRHAFFQVASIITTTGFASTNFDLWPETSRTILVILMFVGACAGSTGGGIKVSRFIIAIKSFIKEIISYLHPRSVKKIKVEGKPLEHETLRATNVYFMTYMVIFAVSVLLVSIENKDLVTNFTAVAATFNNIGPGLSMVGPMENFGHFTDFTKYILMFDMLAGRLEIFPMLLLFCPAVWKRRRA
mgnify:FL=1